MKRLVFFLRFLTAVWGKIECIYQSTGITQPLHINVTGCTTDPPCLVPQHEDIQMEIQFKSPRDIYDMVTEAYAYVVGDIPVPYHLGKKAVTCSSLSCPLVEGESVVYKLSMDVGSWMPIGTVFPVEFVIRDTEDRYVVMCLRLVIRIRNTPTTPSTTYIDILSNDFLQFFVRSKSRS